MTLLFLGSKYLGIDIQLAELSDERNIHDNPKENIRNCSLDIHKARHFYLDV